MKIDPVIRYVITKIDKDGNRTLAAAQQGRNTYATREEAENLLACILRSNSEKTLISVYGDLKRMEVRPCKCYPIHFDPMGIYFDEPEKK